MKTLLPIIAILALCLAGLAMAAPITDCGTISSPGTYDLQNDITTDTGICLIIDADNVILNGHDYHINSTHRNAINIDSRNAITLDHVNVLASNVSGGQWYGIRAHIVNGLTINNSVINGVAGLYADTSNQITVDNTIAYGMTGMIIECTDDVYLHNISGQSSGQWLQLSSTRHAIVDHAVVLYERGGIYLNYPNWCSGSPSQSTGDILIKNSYIRPDVGTALQYWGNANWGDTTNITFINNSFLSNVNPPIRFNNIISGSFHENTVYGGADGFYSLQITNANILIYNNIFNITDYNKLNSSPLTSPTWYTTPVLATNIIGGDHIGGNYWTNPSSTGPSDACTATANHLCSTPFAQGSLLADNYPLTKNAYVCGPNWICNGYGACVNNTKNCTSALDQNSCGLPYTGNYSELGNQSCVSQGPNNTTPSTQSSQSSRLVAMCNLNPKYCIDHGLATSEATVTIQGQSWWDLLLAWLSNGWNPEVFV